MEGVVLHRVGILRFYFCPKQGRGFNPQRQPFTQAWVKSPRAHAQPKWDANKQILAFFAIPVCWKQIHHLATPDKITKKFHLPHFLLLNV